MSKPDRLLTYDDIIALPEDLKRHEIMGGKLYSSSAPPRDHQVVCGALLILAGNYVEEHRLGWFYTYRVDVRLSPYDIVVPDLLFISRERSEIHMPRGDVQGAPSLIAEIIRPESREIDSRQKFDLYERAGVLEYWLVDPETRRFQLFVLKDGRYEEVVVVNGSLCSEAVPGLILAPAKLFARLDRW